MKRVALTAALAAIVALPMDVRRVALAQITPTAETLRREIERRFDVIPLRTASC